MNQFCVDGKKALVTGATAGIGRAAALALAEAGADVAVLGRRDLSLLSDQITKTGREAFPITGDLASAAFIEQAVNCVLDHWNGIDILVNSAGTISRGLRNAPSTTSRSVACGEAPRNGGVPVTIS